MRLVSGDGSGQLHTEQMYLAYEFNGLPDGENGGGDGYSYGNNHGGGWGDGFIPNRWYGDSSQYYYCNYMVLRLP